MDRNSLLRVLAIAGALLLFWKFGLPMITGSHEKTQSLPEEAYVNAPSFVPDKLDPPVEPGKPNIPGTVFAALVLKVLGNGLVLMGAAYYVQDIVLGVIIIGSVAFSASALKKAAFKV